MRIETKKKESKRSLKGKNHKLAQVEEQLKVLSGGDFADGSLPTFKDKIEEMGEYPLRPTNIEIMQVNLGYMCNLVCKHCHVDAGPDRREIMGREYMQIILDIMEKTDIHTLDLTGGAPEMNPDFRWFVTEAKKVGVKDIIVRSNLTIILANKKYYDLPEFFAENNVHVISSLPYYNKAKTDRQRGEGVFSDSIKALKMLNAVGYGMPDSGLKLDLVYNPSGAFLPGNQEQLQADFKRELKRLFDIEFHELFTITNLPISRFLDYLIASENYDDYMETLVQAFNPTAAMNVMCRNTISVDYDGYMYDCDFNIMLAMKVAAPKSQHIKDFDMEALNRRPIFIHQHCYGCTAGAGSSCQGAVT
ncbi:MAG TPA: radical SAM protein [Cryomorphaceae bacterium]|nr:radical SAM protein [Cryomorphaceae bacterium]